MGWDGSSRELLQGLLLGLNEQHLPSASGHYVLWEHTCISQMLLIQTLMKKVLGCFAGGLGRRQIVATRSLVAFRRV